ncbi:MAG: hypothetical protein QOI31_2523 [Solirubrobacterales bacterium]|nr:hypothetical protein [Solirubrobacterales bacterium]
MKIAGRIIWRLVFLAIFGAILYAIGLVNWSEAAKSFRVDHADVRVEVQDDGSLHVTEQLTFDFTGNFSGAFRDIPLAAGVQARNVAVSEAGEEYEPGAATGLGSYDRPGTFGAEQLEIDDPDIGPTRGFRVVWHYEADSEERTFQVSYNITGATEAYDDVIYVPWAVWGSQWQFALDDLHAEIALADSEEEPEGAWLRPRGLGVDPETGPGSATVDVERLPSGEEADMTAVFPRSAVSSVDGATVESGDGLDTILAEEKEIDDDQGLISKAAAFVGENVIPIEIVWTFLVLLGAAWLYFRAREGRVEGVPKYLPEPPSDDSPALAYAYANEGEFDDRLVLATLLDLVDRGFYESKAAEGKEMDLVLSIPEKRPPVDDLEKYEAKTMDFFDDLLNDGGACELGKLKERIPEHSGTWRARWESLTTALDEVEKGKLEWSLTLVNARTTLALTAFLGYFAILLLYFDRTHLISIPLFAMVAGMLFVYLLPQRHLKKMDPESRQKNAEWMAFSQWTKDFPRLSDDPPATLLLWRRIIVYAVAFGTAERLIGSGKIPEPVVEEAMHSGIWLYPQMSGMDSGLTPSFDGFASGFSSQVAPVQSSSSGGGGGFSGGGGGFSGGGGGGAW